MIAMVFERPGLPLQLLNQPRPVPQEGQVLVKVSACGVCRTDLHLIDGELENPKLPVIPGHEIVGYVEGLGPGVDSPSKGQRVGIPWLGSTCRSCHFCMSHRENLCDHAQFTGYTLDGGYAQYTIADARYCFPLTTPLSDIEAAPLLCAGLIGYRSLKFAGEAKRIGIYGFGAAAHIIAQVAIHQGREIYAFTRPGDLTAQAFARALGVRWAGGSDEMPPEPLEAAIIFAAVGHLVPLALRATEKGGTVVLGGIHMSEIPAMPYSILWGERRVQSVANLTRQDAIDFLNIAAHTPIKMHVEAMPLEQANIALDRLRSGKVSGALVLQPQEAAQ
ncbi:MAG: zinc-dependent alcohol dehydrogenase family protein [Hyphomicrobiaceae bacterium]